MVRARRVDLDGRVVEALDVVLLFPFHATILKPNFNLTLRQAQRCGDLDTASSRQIPI